MNKEIELLDGNVILRPDDEGRFDELLMQAGTVHAEMMDDKTLWISLSPEGYEAGERVVMWIRAKKGKLEVSAEED